MAPRLKVDASDVCGKFVSSARMDRTKFVSTVSHSNSEALHSGIDLSQDIKAMQSDTSMVQNLTGGMTQVTALKCVPNLS